MNNPIEGLRPGAVWKYFAEINLYATLYFGLSFALPLNENCFVFIHAIRVAELVYILFDIINYILCN